MRKGQTEIVGIVIIVLLVTIALLFYVSSATNEELTSTGNELYDEYTDSEVATSFAQTLLNTYVPSCQTRFENVVVDCARPRQELRCQGQDSCTVAEQTLDTILNQTLDRWNYAYGLELRYSAQRNLTYSRFNCSRSTVGRSSPAVFPISLFPDPGIARLELGFCD